MNIKGYYVDEDGVIFTVFESEEGILSSNSGQSLEIDNIGFLLVGVQEEEGLRVEQVTTLWPTLTMFAKVLEDV